MWQPYNYRIFLPVYGTVDFIMQLPKKERLIAVSDSLRLRINVMFSVGFCVQLQLNSPNDEAQKCGAAR